MSCCGFGRKLKPICKHIQRPILKWTFLDSCHVVLPKEWHRVCDGSWSFLKHLGLIFCSIEMSATRQAFRMQIILSRGAWLFSTNRKSESCCSFTHSRWWKKHPLAPIDIENTSPMFIGFHKRCRIYPSPISSFLSSPSSNKTSWKPTANPWSYPYSVVGPLPNPTKWHPPWALRPKQPVVLMKLTKQTSAK